MALLVVLGLGQEPAPERDRERVQLSLRQVERRVARLPQPDELLLADATADVLVALAVPR